MVLALPDYVILGVTLGGAVFGLFIGFSGALAFLLGLVAAVGSGVFVWPTFAPYVIASPSARVLASVVLSILVFGLVRFMVRKFVHSLIAQPGDALLGAVTAAASGFVASTGVLFFIVRLGFAGAEFHSQIIERVLVYVPVG